MARQDVVGIGRVVLSRRERIVMLQPRDKGILITTLRYANEVRKNGAYFDDITDMVLPEDMLGLAEHIIQTKFGHFEPEQFVDRYEDALVALLNAKRQGTTFVVAEAPAPAQTTNLMEALRRSIAAESGTDTKRLPPAASEGQESGIVIRL
jgi:DNA end-binding protein Ku